MSSMDSPTFHFKKNKHLSLREHVYQEIRDAIIRGHLEPGSRLRETEIANQMGVSRGPIREAIRILEQEGLVITHPHRETVVVDILENEIKNILVPTRRHFELYSIQLISNVFNEEDYNHLARIVQEMQEAADQDDLDQLSELDVRFHNYIVERCLSPGMYRIWNSIAGKLQSRILILGYKHETLQMVVDEHRELFELIQQGDLNRIEEHLNKHIV